MKEHIVSTYDEDLNSLKSNLVEMGVNCERQLFNAINLTKIINIAKAKEVVKNDDEIDSQERKIREWQRGKKGRIQNTATLTIHGKGVGTSAPALGTLALSVNDRFVKFPVTNTLRVILLKECNENLLRYVLRINAPSFILAKGLEKSVTQ